MLISANLAIRVAQCPGLNVSSPVPVSLENAPRSVYYYHVPETDSISTNLINDTVGIGAGRPNTGMTIREHSRLHRPRSTVLTKFRGACL